MSGPNLLNSAIRYLRGVDPGEAGADAPAGRGECPDSPGGGAGGDHARTLAHFAQARQIVFPESWLDRLEARKGGNEHDTFVDPSEPGWRIKVTGPDLIYLNGRPRYPSPSEATYLERWQLANQVFGDQAQFVGAILTQWGSRIVMRQPEVEAADPESPHPTKTEIYKWLEQAGFEFQSGEWVREADGVAVSDEHIGNFIRTARGIRPIDIDLRQLKSKKDLPIIPWEESPVNPERSTSAADL